MLATSKFTLLNPKCHPRVCWVICIILQLKRTAIEKYRIDTIDKINTINIINCINKYEEN